MKIIRICLIIFFSILSISLASIDAAEKSSKASIPAESCQNFSHDGAWCWFSDPRAIYFEGAKKATYAGWVNSSGDIVIGVYDHLSGKIDTAMIHPEFEADDHANPSLLIRDDRRIMIFYSKHTQPDSPTFLRISKHPEDIREWEPVQHLWLNDNPIYPPEFRRDFCYTNPYQLSAENNKIFLFWRGIDFKPCVSTSTDGGTTWEPGRILVTAEEIYKDRRPYIKYGANGKDKIHFAFTDGHPSREPTNSIYYACYQNGALCRANGKKIASWEAIPITPEQADLVYDASKTGARAWIWDVAEDEKGYPVIVYTRHPVEEDHRYHYARWNGKKWLDYEICRAGKWFPQTPENETEREPHYSGGIALDHKNPTIVYLSRPVNGVFEIEKWTTKNKGRSWRSEAITAGSKNDNVRPFVIRNNPAGASPSVLWMNNRKYVHYTDYETAIKMDVPLKPLSSAIEPDAIAAAMRRVADWQLDHPSQHDLTDWTHGALFTGLTAWAQLANEEKYWNALREFADRNDWKLGDRIYHADDHCVGHTYLELYRRFRDPGMIQPLQDRFDYILQHPSPVTLKYGEQNKMDRWWWCDALFMSPPVWTKLAMITGEKKYLDYMNSEFWATTDYLYDNEEHLFFRDDRYFDQREANGKKVFWSRGNGWVIAGIARLLQDLPQDFSDRSKYVRLFQEMAAKLAEIQPADGLWRPSLLDPDSYPNPETSGSGFFCFALAWGINQKILDKETYLPIVEKAWAGLVQSVHLDGMLGFVQPIGADPKHVTADQTEIYGVGAFLLAGSEMYKLAISSSAP